MLRDVKNGNNKNKKLNANFIRHRQECWEIRKTHSRRQLLLLRSVQFHIHCYFQLSSVVQRGISSLCLLLFVFCGESILIELKAMPMPQIVERVTKTKQTNKRKYIDNNHQSRFLIIRSKFVTSRSSVKSTLSFRWKWIRARSFAREKETVWIVMV